jgi:hypothetical protein
MSFIDTIRSKASSAVSTVKEAVSSVKPESVTNNVPPPAPPPPAAPPPPKDTFEAAKKAPVEINDRLSYKATDWAITDKDVKAVHDNLEALPPAEYKAQLETMQKDGKLGRYTSNMGDAEKKAFLEQAQRKGYVTGGQVKVPGGPLEPPKGPKLYDNKPELPKEVREVIQDQNLSAAKQYDKDYDAYMSRYCKALDKCDSAEKLRALGHWAPKHPLGKEPGYDASNTSDPFANKWADERID